MPVIPGGTPSYSPALTAQQLIKDALLEIGAKAANETLTAAETQDGLRRLNFMLDLWNADRLMVYARTRDEFTLDGSDSYDIGVGQTFDAARPMEITEAYYRRSDGTEVEIEVFTRAKWGAISDKSSEGEPSVIYYEPSFPNGLIRLWPVPQSGTLILHSETPLQQITSPTATFYLPPGYAEAVVLNLAVRLAPQYGQQDAIKVTAPLAQEALRVIKRRNLRPVEVKNDSALTQKEQYDILRGY